MEWSCEANQATVKLHFIMLTLDNVMAAESNRDPVPIVSVWFILCNQTGGFALMVDGKLRGKPTVRCDGF